MKAQEVKNKKIEIPKNVVVKKEQAVVVDTKTQPRKLKGVVVSDKMAKTVVVAVSRLKQHPKYKQRYKVTARYKAHSENNEFKVGDKVIIEETRPISKDKKWRVISKY